MADWVTVLAPGVIGLVGAVIGASAMIIAKRFLDADYLRYRDVKRQAECVHIPVESDRTAPFCSKCKKTLTNDDLARQEILRCPHDVDVEDRGYDEFTFSYQCRVCGRVFTEPHNRKVCEQ